jgi:excisionase family DNA binding protein
MRIDMLPTQKMTMSVEEAGKRLGISRNTAYEAARQRQIPTIRIGRRVLVPVAAFEAMLADTRSPAGRGDQRLKQ